MHIQTLWLFDQTKDIYLFKTIQDWSVRLCISIHFSTFEYVYFICLIRSWIFVFPPRLVLVALVSFFSSFFLLDDHWLIGLVSKIWKILLSFTNQIEWKLKPSLCTVHAFSQLLQFHFSVGRGSAAIFG